MYSQREKVLKLVDNFIALPIRSDDHGVSQKYISRYGKFPFFDLSQFDPLSLPNGLDMYKYISWLMFNIFASQLICQETKYLVS